MTSTGWRDAEQLQYGTQLVFGFEASGSGTGAARGATMTIESMRVQKIKRQVFNLEVANSHTYLIGDSGVVVHNGRCTPRMRREWEQIHGRSWPKNPMTEKIRPGGNQDGHHIVPKSKGGADHGSNITPMTPSEHMEHHKTHGYK